MKKVNSSKKNKEFKGEQYSAGRKIPPKFENPIDDILLDICDEMIDFCQEYDITPNAITVFRTLLGIFTLYYFNFSSNLFFPITGMAIFYFLDCLDGHLARKTNQVSILGDYLDHYADMSFGIGVIYILINKMYSNKVGILITMFTLLYLSCVHLGLQQKNYKIIKKDIREANITNTVDEIDDELLDYLNSIHSLSYDNIYWTKYFGTGTLYFIMLCFVYYVQTHGVA